ncbi:hypothetical protein [uncultured Shewanella sp.]|uniref:hypothetical protein n=1 Tax=uncultured Shewanella sp. TaxID=173975 RepID=UPI00262CA084|nr:hypothetical protein [uncultured Shewanella sp.]
MFKFKYISVALLGSVLFYPYAVQAGAPLLEEKSAQQLMTDPILQEEMNNIKEQTQCESYLYQADKPLVVATSSELLGVSCPIAKQFIQLELDLELVPLYNAEKGGVMLRFEVSGSYYILALKGEVSSCSKSVKSSAKRLAPLL